MREILTYLIFCINEFQPLQAAMNAEFVKLGVNNVTFLVYGVEVVGRKTLPFTMVLPMEELDDAIKRQIPLYGMCSAAPASAYLHSNSIGTFVIIVIDLRYLTTVKRGNVEHAE